MNYKTNGALLLNLALALPAVLLSQTIAFDAASIKSLPPENIGHIHMRRAGSIVDYSSVGLKDLISEAYGVTKDQISGPPWLDSEMFAISARIPAGASAKQIPEMFQGLLRDRFGMTVHRETRETAVLALVVAKGGPKLRPVDTATGCDSNGDVKGTVLTCHAPISQLADVLSRHNGLSRVVIDRTQLQGIFEINLEWPRDEPEDPAGASLMDALPRQLGLRLESQKAPQEFIVVDAANRAPTEN